MIQGIEGIMMLIDICVVFGDSTVHDSRCNLKKGVPWALAPKNKGQGAQQHKIHRKL